MPGGVLPYQKEFVSKALMERMPQYDFRIGTLECAVGDSFAYDEEKMRGRANIIYARNEDLKRVKEIGIDVVSLANNHVYDLGQDGLKNTLLQLQQLGIMYCGAGMDDEEASRPAVVCKDGVSVAFLAYCKFDSPWLGRVKLAGSGSAGVNPLIKDKVVDEIREAKKMYDVVIILPHWGKEYSHVPLPEDVEMAKAMVEAGADAVMGSHTHQIQPLVRYKGVPVCYSMGNFLFPDFYMQPPRPIWYPDELSIRSEIAAVDDYIFPVNEFVLRVWDSFSRQGMAVNVTIKKGQVSAGNFFTRLSSDNIIELDNLDGQLRFQIWKESLKLNSDFFRHLLHEVRRFKTHHNQR